jgi:diguanylate cyclase (GGDEF)-like protein
VSPAPSPDEIAIALAATEALRFGLFAVDVDHRLCLWNGFMAHHTGKSREVALGQDVFTVLPGAPRAWLERQLRTVFVLGTYAFSRWQDRPYLAPFAHDRPITGGIDAMRQDVTFFPVAGPDGAVRACAVAVFDATDNALAHLALQAANADLGRAMSELESLTRTDPLTGLANRRHFDAVLAAELKRFERYDTPLALIILDLDHFKQVNDTHGHAAGDAVLQQVARRLRSLTRETDVVARYGGEEMCVVLPCTPLGGAAQLAERLRTAVADAPVLDGEVAIPVTASFGVACAQRPAILSAAALVTAADSALYRAKHGGRNRVELSSWPIASSV